MSDDKGLKRFNGEAEDPGKDLKRWKAWAMAKCMTMKDLKSHQRGPWLFTLLDGAAFETVEHLSLEEIAVEDGHRKIWEALHNRFPEKEKHDQMGEALGEVFSLVAARVKETFERCRRKADIDFPKAARGWITLNCVGLSEQAQVDTGCGRTLIGSDTLQTFNNLLNKHGRAPAVEHPEKNRFRFGNG